MSRATLLGGQWASSCGGALCCGAHALGVWVQEPVGPGRGLRVVHGLSCSAACGNFPDQGLNPWPLHWQVDSYPLYHQGSLVFFLIISWAVISEQLCKWQKALINTVLANNNYVSSKNLLYFFIFFFKLKYSWFKCAVSGVQQSDSVTNTHSYMFWIFPL